MVRPPPGLQPPAGLGGGLLGNDFDRGDFVGMLILCRPAEELGPQCRRLTENLPRCLFPPHSFRIPESRPYGVCVDRHGPPAAAPTGPRTTTGGVPRVRIRATCCDDGDGHLPWGLGCECEIPVAAVELEPEGGIAALVDVDELVGHDLGACGLADGIRDDDTVAGECVGHAGFTGFRHGDNGGAVGADLGILGPTVLAIPGGAVSGIPRCNPGQVTGVVFVFVVRAGIDAADVGKCVCMAIRGRAFFAGGRRYRLSQRVTEGLHRVRGGAQQKVTGHDSDGHGKQYQLYLHPYHHMKLIRAFLWTLVLCMTLQGFLHADDYGAAIGLLGGVSLTLSVWRESLAAGVRSLWSSAPATVGLPRALVVAALEETGRHPGLHTLPPLRRAQMEYKRSWDAFRDAEVGWMLEHARLVGGVAAQAEYLWAPWAALANESATAAARAEGGRCWVKKGSEKCQAIDRAVTVAKTSAAVAAAADAAWERVLAMDPTISVSEWWRAHGAATGGASGPTEVAEMSAAFIDSLRELHDVEWPSDPRVSIALGFARSIGSNVTDSWLARLVTSLSTRDVWAACLEHVRQRESRVQMLMVAAGVQDMFNAHDRILNASLKVVAAGPAEHRVQVQQWFGEMLGYAWWLGDDVPAIVRRCVGQEAGDCRRIGPTEITSLSDQMYERSRVLEDWSRRLFIGMWNALPALAILFLVEIAGLCLGYRFGGRGGPVYDDLRLVEVTEAPKRLMASVDSRKMRRVRRLRG